MDSKWIRYIPFVLTVFLYSTMEVVSKPLLSRLYPETITGIRFIVGGLIVLPFVRDFKNFTLKTHLVFFLVGVLNIFIAMNALQISIKYIPAGMAASLLSSNALFVYILSHFTEKENVKIKELLTIASSIFAIVLISNRIEVNLKGVLWVLTASFSFAVYTLISRYLSIKYSIRGMTAFSFIYGGLFTLLFAIVKHPVNGDILKYQVLFIPLLYLGIFVTGLGYIMFFLTIKYNSSRLGSYVFLIKPILAVLWGFLFLKEKLDAIQYIGIALLVISLYLLLYFRTKR